MTVEFEGEERTMPEMGRYLEVTDREVREGAWKGDRRTPTRERDEIDDIYEEMIGKRNQLAKNAGFDNLPRLTSTDACIGTTTPPRTAPSSTMRWRSTACPCSAA